MNFSYKDMSTIKTKVKGIIKRSVLMGSLFLFTAIIPQIAFASEITSDNLIRLINRERTERGLNELRSDEDLNRAANLKSKDMLSRSYFEHYYKNRSPWDFVLLGGYNYLYAGENLAMDFNTAEGMVRAWMNSPAHRDNILSEDYEDIGLGVIKGVYTENNQSHETTMVTNMFGKRKTFIHKAIDNIKKIFPIF